MTIIPYSHKHAQQVAALHCAYLNGLLTELGPAAARVYYTAAAESPLALAYVAAEGNHIAGFVLGTRAPAALKRDVLRHRPLAMAAAIVLGMLRHPAALLWLLQSLRRPSEGTYDGSTAELTYLAVDPAHHGAGIGRQLVAAFTRALHEGGVQRYELSVDEDNQAAIGFYGRLGFVRLGRYHEFGQYHLRYRIETDMPDGQR